MKISEFAAQNDVTAKMLRHYDEIGLLKPAAIDPETGYRSYKPEQSRLLNWIMILKNLDFSLAEIKELLSRPIEGKQLIEQLIRKRIEITSTLNEQIQKKITIDRLITIIKKEGFHMGKKWDALKMEQTDVHEIKKNMPNMEMFLEAASNIAALCSNDDRLSVLRFDISHFKQVNDDYGFEVGDNVIVACYMMIETNVKKYLNHATIGRAHGDEFVVFAKATKEEINQTAEAIVDDMNKFEFVDIGCLKQMGCYLGGVTGQVARPIQTTDIRRMIENSIEALHRAREVGPNSIFIENCGL